MKIRTGLTLTTVDFRHRVKRLGKELTEGCRLGALGRDREIESRELECALAARLLYTGIVVAPPTIRVGERFVCLCDPLEERRDNRRYARLMSVALAPGARPNTA
ncbi:MAG: hypothetical protein M3541_07145 [Acidobacteriota bacterium]|nr:hypothetical protein [Acidobacteriota bacterium]